MIVAAEFFRFAVTSHDAGVIAVGIVPLRPVRVRHPVDEARRDILLIAGNTLRRHVSAMKIADRRLYSIGVLVYNGGRPRLIPAIPKDGAYATLETHFTRTACNGRFDSARISGVASAEFFEGKLAH